MFISSNRFAYTLIELMTVLLIIAGLSVCTFHYVNYYSVNRSAKLIVDQIRSSMLFAKQEAMRRKCPVYICAANYNKYARISRKPCNSYANSPHNLHHTNWSKGILIYVDNDENGDYTGQEAENIKDIYYHNQSINISGDYNLIKIDQDGIFYFYNQSTQPDHSVTLNQDSKVQQNLLTLTIEQNSSIEKSNFTKSYIDTVYINPYGLLIK